MKHTRFIIMAWVFIQLFTWRLEAQVNPGDADNNGIVDNQDVLFIGYAFGSVGPRRSYMEGDTLGPVSLYWEESFPTGQNYIYADADGNGVVGWEDFLEVYNNYGVRYHNRRITTIPTGHPQTDPHLDLQLQDSAVEITEGSVILIPMQLGESSNPINEFQGLAFSIEFDSTYIREVRWDLLNNDWLGGEDALFALQAFPFGREAVLDVGLTRLGQNPVSGFGNIGILSIIIEDDLVDFRPFEKDSIQTIIGLDKIALVDVDFNYIPVVGDQLQLNIINPRLISSDKKMEWSSLLSIFPNPVSDVLHIVSPVPILSLELRDAQGHLLYGKQEEMNNTCRLSLAGLPQTMFILRLFTEKGMITRKVFHVSDP